MNLREAERERNPGELFGERVELLAECELCDVIDVEARQIFETREMNPRVFAW